MVYHNSSKFGAFKLDLNKIKITVAAVVAIVFIHGFDITDYDGFL
jgi:hypothetical protein